MSVREALAYLDDLRITSAKVSRSLTVEFWKELGEMCRERAALVQEELDEHGESGVPGEEETAFDEDDEEDEDEEDDG